MTIESNSADDASQLARLRAITLAPEKYDGGANSLNYRQWQEIWRLTDRVAALELRLKDRQEQS